MNKKLVYESLNEVISFERGGDPLSNLGIGKKKLIENWLLENIETDSEKYRQIFGKPYYYINKDYTIDTNDDVNLNTIEIIKFPQYIKFNIIKGYFSCASCNLISLKGCPEIVNLDFSCSHNNLSSLKGCPTFVGGYFYCGSNKVKFTKEDVRKLCNVKKEIYV